MAIIIQIIREYAPWVYGICALIALWYLRIVLVARRERRFAVFSLEREAALNRTYNAWSVAFGLVAVIGVIYFLSTAVADAVQPFVEDVRTPTATATIARASPSPTLPVLSPQGQTPAPTSAATRGTPTPGRPTPTPRATSATPTAAPTTPAPAVSAPGCPDPRAVITSPGMNAQVSGSVAIMGSAAHESFKYYKLEYGAGAGPAVWSYFDGGENPVRGGRLGTLNAGALPPGTYSIRIIVVDASGNYPPPCQTTIIRK